MPDAQSVTAAAAPSAAPSEEPPDPPQSPWMLAAAEILRNQRVQIQFEVWTPPLEAEEGIATKADWDAAWNEIRAG